MTVFQFVLMIILIIVIVGGLYYAYRGYTSSKASDPEHGDYDKNGIPIIPRHERNLVDTPDIDDTLAGETVITPDHEHLRPVVNEADPNLAHLAQAGYSDNDYLNQNHTATDGKLAGYNSANDMDDHLDFVNDTSYDQQSHTDEVSPISGFDDGSDWDLDKDTQQQNAYNSAINTDSSTKESDLFSSLASATENIMPPVDIAEEPEFDDNSPVLDQHLLAEADQDQNSPLNHAEENINITLIPKNKFETIDGATIRDIVEQYGLKYGAMNMFHRYENKDGTGILWFSMMGMTFDGVTPFDLNKLMTDEYNGLVLFLSLPHPKAVQGFDSMMSVAGLIARQLDTQILDEENRPLTREHKMQLRQAVQDYQ